MSKINTGGPAFPNPCLADEAYAAQPGDYGMTLRDWFAGAIPLATDEPSAAMASALMGREVPNWHADPLVAIRWWTDAEAKLRYMKADAMIAAREGGAA